MALMPIGPGKYDDLCTLVRKRAKASGAVLIVFDGSKGPGFSVQATPMVTLQLPLLLEQIAADLRASFKAGKL
jgi:hypothetical protein